MTTLENGLYAITNNAENRHIGRFPIEELTLLPKPLLALPQGVEGPNVRAQVVLLHAISTSYTYCSSWSRKAIGAITSKPLVLRLVYGGTLSPRFFSRQTSLKIG